MHIRLSTAADIPALRELWELAFGDSGPYMDNFFRTYYRPERMIVLEEGDAVRAMTAWFDTTFVVPGQGTHRAAYLYAVATHPQERGKGLAGELLAWADEHFRSLGIPAVTTVPAQPSLHNFFGANGFRECFAYDELAVPTKPGAAPDFVLDALTPRTYGELREALLMDVPHISYPVDALEYQRGCCALSGGGLYAADTGRGVALLCAEGMEDGTLLLKELLGQPTACDALLKSLPVLLPNFSGICRVPGKTIPFGMLKWLDKTLAGQWDWENLGYLGLAFD